MSMPSWGGGGPMQHGAGGMVPLALGAAPLAPPAAWAPAGGSLLVPLAPQPLQPHPLAAAGSDPQKSRLRWTPELHARFTAAVKKLGGPFAATPKRILAAMGLPELTTFHIKSHLQKYRSVLASSRQGSQHRKKGRQRSSPAKPAADSGSGDGSAPEAGTPAAAEAADLFPSEPASSSDWAQLMEGGESGDLLGAVCSGQSGGAGLSSASLCWAGSGSDAAGLLDELLAGGGYGGVEACEVEEGEPSGSLEDLLSLEWLAGQGAGLEGAAPCAALPPPRPPAPAPAVGAGAAAAAGSNRPASGALPAAQVDGQQGAQEEEAAAEDEEAREARQAMLRRALRLQLDMQKQLSATIQQQQELQQQLQAHHKYLERLLREQVKAQHTQQAQQAQHGHQEQSPAGSHLPPSAAEQGTCLASACAGPTAAAGCATALPASSHPSWASSHTQAAGSGLVLEGKRSGQPFAAAADAAVGADSLPW